MARGRGMKHPQADKITFRKRKKKFMVGVMGTHQIKSLE
jgi:hypothetical protein